MYNHCYCYLDAPASLRFAVALCRLLFGRGKSILVLSFSQKEHRFFFLILHSKIYFIDNVTTERKRHTYSRF